MRRRAVWIATVACALAIGARARAVEEPAPAPPGPSWRGAVLPEQWKPIPPNPSTRIPDPITHDDVIQRVTLKETIAIAVENNPGIAARRLDPAKFGSDVLGAQSAFDPSFTSELGESNQTLPNASALSSTTNSVINDRYANFHLTKLLRSGTQLSTDFLNDRLDNNATYLSFRPQYSPHLGFSVVQPLLRDFGWDFSYLVVRVAEKQADSAVYLYEADLADFVERVIRAYWRVVGTRENVAVRREAKALADRTVEENEARVRVGLFAPVAVLEAQADAAQRAEELISAENDLDVARQELAQLCFFRPAGTFVPRTLEPTEEAAPEDVHPEVDQTLATAMASRPEIIASSLGVEARQIEERRASNGLLPRVDLVGGYAVNGLSGQGQVTSGSVVVPQGDYTNAHPGSCIPIPGTAVAGAGQLFSCTLVRATAPTGSLTDAYGSRAATGGLLSGDYNTYSFGLRLTVPLDNALARSVHTRSQIELDQAELNHRDLLSNVTTEVRRTVADVIAGKQRIESAHVASQLAEENLRNQEKRHEVGMATTKDLLDFQQRLTQARFTEVTAKFDYANAVAAWRRAQGRLLDHYQIVVQHPGARTTPWFARF